MIVSITGLNYEIRRKQQNKSCKKYNRNIVAGMEATMKHCKFNDTCATTKRADYHGFEISFSLLKFRSSLQLYDHRHLEKFGY